MARERSAVQWDRLTPAYRDRLLRNGVSRDDYLSGANLSQARGQSNESHHKQQLRILEKYGPRKKPEGMVRGEPEITPAMLRNARKHYGDAWVTERLRQMKVDYKKSERGLFPRQGDVKLSERSDANQTYGLMAKDPEKGGTNVYAAFWWYKGVFGKHGYIGRHTRRTACGYRVAGKRWGLAAE